MLPRYTCSASTTGADQKEKGWEGGGGGGGGGGEERLRLYSLDHVWYFESVYSASALAG